MADSAQKQGLGRLSVYVYPILAVLFAYFAVHYDGLRQTLWGETTTGSSRDQVLQQFYQMRTEFFSIDGGLILLGLIWFFLVRRDKRKHPERYLKYIAPAKTKKQKAKAP